MPIQDFFKYQSTLNKIQNCGMLSSYLNPFSDWLSYHQFSIMKAARHITNVAHLSYYLKSSIKKTFSFDINLFNNYSFDFLTHHIPVCSCSGWNKIRRTKEVNYSLNRFKQFLTACYGIEFEKEYIPFSTIYNQYRVWLSENRQLAKSTIRLRSQYLRKLLNWYFKKYGSQSLKELKTQDIESFFFESTKKWGRAYKRSLQTTLRGFFDFCYEQNYTPQNFRYSLPSVKSYKLSHIPKAIDERESIKFINSIDRSSKSGKRIYAILLLLITYGIRGGQIKALKLKDINWQAEKISFPAHKGGKESILPLTAEVGNALMDYLKNARVKSHYQEVFLTMRAPFVPIKPSKGLLPQIIRSYMLKAHIQSPSKGCHCFRHGFVSRMLKQGFSLKYIADIIGHKHISTTFIYTKIDFRSLSDIPLELPEVGYEEN
ncbi:MAG: site-specific integrase [bacterium]